MKLHSNVVTAISNIANTHPEISDYCTIFRNDMAGISKQAANMLRTNLTSDVLVIHLDCGVTHDAWSGNDLPSLTARLEFASLEECESSIAVCVNCHGAEYWEEVSLPVNKTHAHIVSVIGNIVALHPELAEYGNVYKNAKASWSAKAESMLQHNETGKPLVISLDCGTTSQGKPTVKVSAGYYRVTNCHGGFVVVMDCGDAKYLAFGNKSSVCVCTSSVRNYTAI